MARVSDTIERGERTPDAVPFRCDTRALKRWLDRRKASLERVRRDFEPLWLDIRRHLEPHVGLGLVDAGTRDRRAAVRDDDLILHSGPRQDLHEYASGMQSGITNQAQDWFQFVAAHADEEVSESSDLKRFFDQATRAVGRAFQQGNVYQTTDQVYLHAAVFGTSACLLLRGDAPGEIFLNLVDEGDYWIAENRCQKVDTLLRRIEMTLAQVVDDFGHGNLPPNWLERIREGRLEDRVTVWNLICPNEGGGLFADVNPLMPFASFYWIGDGAVRGSTATPLTGANTELGARNNSDQILDVRGFSYNPIVTCRQQYVGSVYGKGLGEKALGDIKELYRLEEQELRAIVQEQEPPLWAPASLKGRINEYPGGVTYLDTLSPMDGAPLGRLFEPNPTAIQFTEGKINAVMARIDKIFCTHLFGVMMNINSQSAKTMTATEVNELAAEKVTLLGPVLTRMDRDFLTPLVTGALAILVEDGFVGGEDEPIPDEIANGETGINCRYVSSLHTEMAAMVKMRGTLKMLDITGMVAQVKPEVVDKIDGDQIIDEVSGLYPNTGRFVLDDDKVAKIRGAREEAAREERRQAALLEMSKSAGTQAKALAETPVGNGNALEALVAGGAV